MKKMLSVLYRILCSIISIQIIISSVSFAASYNTNGIDGIINKILAYQKSQNNGKIFNSSTVGTNDSDWFIVGASRSGKGANFEEYRTDLLNNVNFSQMNATDLHRISLAVLSSGGNPQNYGNSNLIASGVYNRGKTSSLGKEGVIGWIWGLIALDSGQYSIPNGASYSRDDIIVEILRQQLNDGGFALSGSNADAAVTALAITALSPYINQDYSYSYTLVHSGAKVNKSIKNVIDESVARLSAIQNSNGTFSSATNTPNATSTAQAIIGLCSVGINPNTDPRFIKSGSSAIDGLLKYQLQSGGFAHSFAQDSSKPEFVPNKENSYASAQALLALASYRRFINNQRKLFDFKSEFSGNTLSAITTLNQMLNSLTDDTVTVADIDKIKELYNSLSASDRAYVYNYSKIYALSESANLNSSETSLDDDDSIYDTGAMAKYQTGPNTEVASMLISKGLMGVRLHLANIEAKSNNLDSTFTESDREKLNEACKTLSTKHYYTLLNLINKIEKCTPFEDIENVKTQLYTQKTAVETLISDIENINTEISEKLSPLEEVSISDRELMHNLSNRINVLSDYDKNKIQDIDKFEKALLRVDSMHTTILISIVVIQLLVVVSAIVMFMIKKNKATINM